MQTPAENPTLLPYEEVKQNVSPILQEWEAKEGSCDGGNAKKRRDIRRDETNVEALRARGDLGPDECYIPQRIVDRRIKDEVPGQLNFLESPERILIFVDPENPNKATENLERAFTQSMRYQGWTLPWIRAFDGCNLHGGVALEVKFDITKPLHCSVEYIRREDLIFPLEATSLDSCEYILQRFKYSPFELESFVAKYGFDQLQVAKLTQSNKTGAKRMEKVEIYKVWCKKKDQVFVFWYSNSCDTYLKKPEPLQLGLYDTASIMQWRTMMEEFRATNTDPLNPPPAPPAQLPVREYPLFWLPYEVIEDDKLLASRGRVFRDSVDQEVLTQVWTTTINAAVKAAGIYASYVNNPLNVENTNETDKIVPGTIAKKEAKFWSFPFPSGDLIALATQYSTNSSALNSRVDYAVNNRNDSRKTAREVSVATAQQAQQTGAAMSAQSLTFLNVYSLCWQIGRSQTLLGATTLPVLPEDLLPEYRLATAGDVDVVTRENKKNIIRETFPYIANTPIANIFLTYLVETYFPEKSREWIPALMAGDPTDLIAKSAQLLQASMTPSLLSDERKQQLMQFIQMLNQYVQSRQGAVPAGTQPMEQESPDASTPPEPQQTPTGLD